MLYSHGDIIGFSKTKDCALTKGNRKHKKSRQFTAEINFWSVLTHCL